MVPEPTDRQINSWLSWSIRQLYPSINNPKQESEWLLSALLQCHRSDLLLNKVELSPGQIKTYKQWIYRRKTGEPAQYITGWTEFYGRRFNLSKEVLIPRQETERLIDVAIYTFQELVNPILVDIGTGSGCIAISIGAEIPHGEMEGRDISPDALAIAEENASLNQVSNVSFIQSDFLNDPSPNQIYDGLVMNPPYIPQNAMESLMDEVRLYEPNLALTDHEDGLVFYRHLARYADQWVQPGGYLIMEVGVGDHPQNVANCFRKGPFDQLEFVTDFNGDNRVLKVKVI